MLKYHDFTKLFEVHIDAKTSLSKGFSCRKGTEVLLKANKIVEHNSNSRFTKKNCVLCVALRHGNII